MEGNNTAPFRKGQKAVSLVNGYQTPKGKVVTILDCFFQGCNWFVDIGLISPVSFTLKCRCGKAHIVNVDAGKSFCPEAVCFAPIETRTHELEIEKEIFDSLPAITEESLDVVVKPETVTNLHQQLLDSIDEMIALLPSLPEDQQDYYTDKIRGMIEKANELVQS